jgi:ribosomal protein L11 methyltransferase
MSVVWFELRLEIPAAYSDAVANFLMESGAPGLQLEEHGATVSLVTYYPSLPALEPMQRYCADLGAPLDAGAIRMREIAEQDWAENWKLNFHPQSIGERLYVCPPWDAAAPPDRLAIVIEPGMAFGTGQHATTRGCLSALDWALQTRCVGRALDVGTGSGILAIALAKLGVPEVWAIDVDPQALAIAEANAARNGVAKQIRFTFDTNIVADCADLLVANLFTNLLLDSAARFASLVVPDGLLICSGFIEDDEQRVRRTYESFAFDLARRYEQDGWVTLALERSARR